MMTFIALALAAFCALPRSQCADFDLIADLLQASIDKANSFDPGRYNSTREAASVIDTVRKKLGRDLHLLEQGLLSGNEGRMSALIAKVKFSVDAMAGGFEADPASVSDAWLQTTSAVLQVLREIERMLEGHPGWTPSWHYISQFLESFLHDSPRENGDS
ncbi:uncharacterized protein LOC112126285 [Cimex lectularius]|uniref:Uncharacterized protein n=1 Tax=Cimex lectularius TaxID=79782 RepID=A0A8I6SF11_CIMLE|nr:uncharacterized protein LOC112126285 [Cimex lectularius]